MNYQIIKPYSFISEIKKKSIYFYVYIFIKYYQVLMKTKKAVNFLDKIAS